MTYIPQTGPLPPRAGRPICVIADAFCPVQEPQQGRVLKAYFATLEEQSHEQAAAGKKKKTTIRTAQFRRASQAIPGRKVWLIVEASGLEGVRLEISVRCAKKDELLALDEVLTLVSGGAEQQGFQVTIGGWNGGGRYQNTEAYRGWAIAELEPGPATVTERNAWAKQLEACSGHRALFYVEVRALTGIPTEYLNEDPQRPGLTHDKAVFLNESGKHLELLTCCRADITHAQLKAVFPGAPADKIQGIADAFNQSYTVNGTQQKLFEIFHVDSCLRRAHFFAQAKVESENVRGQQLIGAFEGESFNYRVSKLLDGTTFTFINDPDKTHLIEAALSYGKGPYTHIYADGKRKREIPESQKADEKALANTFNMDINRPPRIRLGNTIDGDGWKFRGHGILQLTGRENYTNAQRWLDEVLPDNTADLLNCADTFTAFQVVATGGYYWCASHSLFVKADKGTSNDVTDSITRQINSGMKKKQERRDALVQTIAIFQQQHCINAKQ